jgi:hypothetical protein
LKEVVASMNSIIENVNTRPSARRKAEKQRAECKENLQDLLVAEKSPDQEQALREAIQHITRRHIAQNPNGTVSNIEKVLEELRRREGIKNQE